MLTYEKSVKKNIVQIMHYLIFQLIPIFGQFMYRKNLTHVFLAKI